MTDAEFIEACRSRSQAIAAAIGPVESDPMASSAQMTALTDAVGRHVAALVQCVGLADPNAAIGHVATAANLIHAQVVRIALLSLTPPRGPRQ